MSEMNRNADILVPRYNDSPHLMKPLHSVRTYNIAKTSGSKADYLSAKIPLVQKDLIDELLFLSV